MNVAVDLPDPSGFDNEWNTFAYAEKCVRWKPSARNVLTGHHAHIHEIADGRAAYLHYSENVVRLHITCAVSLLFWA